MLEIVVALAVQNVLGCDDIEALVEGPFQWKPEARAKKKQRQNEDDEQSTRGRARGGRAGWLKWRGELGAPTLSSRQ
jgi:hypothetical protein